MHKFFKTLLKLAGLSILIFLSPANGQSLDEAKVFEWWDDGIVSPEEAQEMLNLLEEGNEREACFLAEIYALENCDQKVAKAEKQKAAKATPAKNDLLNAHGKVLWKAQMDSLGELSKSRYNLQLDFYKFSLRLGSSELLSYKDKGAEAYFGQISTREFHSYIPLDTLWGTSLRYSVKRLILNVALDTAGNIQGGFGYSHKDLSLSAAFWHAPGSESISLQGKSPWGEFSLWQILARNPTLPLIKFQLHNKEQGKNQNITWKTTAYFHGDSIPGQAKLTSTLQKNRLWGTQAIGVSFFDRWTTKLNGSARISMPLDSDSLSAQFKFTAESGPHFLRGTLSATCVEANENCQKTDWKLKVESPIASSLGIVTAKASIKCRYTFHQNFSLPRIEFGAGLSPNSGNSIQFTAVFPQGNPLTNTQIRSQVNITADQFPKVQCSLATTFQKRRDDSFHPTHGIFKATVQF